MSEVIFLILYFGGPVLLLGLAFFAGNWIAKKHEKDMALRQQAVAHMTLTDLSSFQHPNLTGPAPQLLM